jgi:hypothetical protein
MELGAQEDLNVEIGGEKNLYIRKLKILKTWHG